MVTAHLDEIGLMVKSIDEKGLSLSQILGCGQQGPSGPGSCNSWKERDIWHYRRKPPHLLTPEEIKKAVKMEDLVIDTGFLQKK